MKDIEDFFMIRIYKSEYETAFIFFNSIDKKEQCFLL